MKVIVIGAGVVGLSAALMAQGRGLSVTVVDREGPAAGASAGNAGAFAFTDILPLAERIGRIAGGEQGVGHLWQDSSPASVKVKLRSSWM